MHINSLVQQHTKAGQACHPMTQVDKYYIETDVQYVDSNKVLQLVHSNLQDDP